jgi:hypothetical protein
MAFKMRGFPTHNTSAFKQKSALKQDPAAMEAMAGMMGGGAMGAMEGAPIEEEVVEEKDDNIVTPDEFADWFYETEPEGWDAVDVEATDKRVISAVKKINNENPDTAEIEKMTLILKELEK